MNFVESLNFFGVEAKEIPCIKGSGAPTTATQGAVGSFYMDTVTGDVYKCVAVSGGVYEWTITPSNNAFKEIEATVDAMAEMSFDVTEVSNYVDDTANFEKIDNAFWNADEKQYTSTAWEYYKKNVTAGEVYHIVAKLGQSAPIVFYNESSTQRKGTYPKDLSKDPGTVDCEITIPEGITSIVINNNKLITAVIEKRLNGNTLKIVAPKDDYLYGKRLVACGDSITDAYDLEAMNGSYIESYAERAAKRHNMTFTKNAVSGSTMAYNAGGDAPVSTSAFSNTRYLNLPEFDYLTLWFGWNDHAYSTVGTIEDNDNTTFYGAYKAVLDHLVTTNPTKKIGLIVPYGPDTEKMRAIAQAVRDISNMYGVPCLDLRDYNECSAFWEKTDGNAAIVARRNALTFDTTHPNAAGHDFLSTMYDNFLKRL